LARALEHELGLDLAAACHLVGLVCGDWV
jgi:hypothetical protein